MLQNPNAAEPAEASLDRHMTAEFVVEAARNFELVIRKSSRGRLVQSQAMVQRSVDHLMVVADSIPAELMVEDRRYSMVVVMPENQMVADSMLAGLMVEDRSYSMVVVVVVVMMPEN